MPSASTLLMAIEALIKNAPVKQQLRKAQGADAPSARLNTDLPPVPDRDFASDDLLDNLYPKPPGEVHTVMPEPSRTRVDTREGSGPDAYPGTDDLIDKGYTPEQRAYIEANSIDPTIPNTRDDLPEVFPGEETVAPGTGTQLGSDAENALKKRRLTRGEAKRGEYTKETKRHLPSSKEARQDEIRREVRERASKGDYTLDEITTKSPRKLTKDELRIQAEKDQSVDITTKDQTGENAPDEVAEGLDYNPWDDVDEGWTRASPVHKQDPTIKEANIHSDRSMGTMTQNERDTAKVKAIEGHFSKYKDQLGLIFSEDSLARGDHYKTFGPTVAKMLDDIDRDSMAANAFGKTYKARDGKLKLFQEDDTTATFNSGTDKVREKLGTGRKITEAQKAKGKQGVTDVERKEVIERFMKAKTPLSQKAATARTTKDIEVMEQAYDEWLTPNMRHAYEAELKSLIAKTDTEVDNIFPDKSPGRYGSSTAITQRIGQLEDLLGRRGTTVKSRRNNQALDNVVKRDRVGPSMDRLTRKPLPEQETLPYNNPQTMSLPPIVKQPRSGTKEATQTRPEFSQEQLPQGMSTTIPPQSMENVLIEVLKSLIGNPNGR